MQMAEPTFYAQLQQFVGVEIGPPSLAPDLVNIPMIRHWCEAIGDSNPIYLDEAAAAASVHGGIVAPPTMLQAWGMKGITTGTGDLTGPYWELTHLLASHGFSAVLGTNTETTYHRYLRPGDHLRQRVVIDSVSQEKTTALGHGHFLTTREEYTDQNGELVGTMIFRILRYRPHAKIEPVPPTPPRPQPSVTPDSAWWFDALNDGRLLIQRCTACETLRFPTGPSCPHCHSVEWDSIEAAGTGTIHSFVVAHYPQVPGFEYPLPIVLVELDEGVRMTMNVIGTTRESIAIGQPVQVEIIETDPNMKLPFARVPTNGTAGTPTGDS